MVWLWVLGGAAVWLLTAVLVALTIGRGVRIADDRTSPAGLPVGFSTADLPLALQAPSQIRDAAVRGPVPLPAVGIGLILVALALETAGYGIRLTGGRGPLASVLAMDGPYSVPRMFVAGLFAVTAVAAVAGAGTQPRRRRWWAAVALVGGGVAVVKAGSTWHVEALAAAEAVLGATGAFLLSSALAGGLVAALWFLSRDERRDRRRVLGALSCYAVAVVALSALSSAVADAYGAGSRWSAAATYVEESGEALAGVAFLMAVLVGVAPQLVLPRSWALRRRADPPARGPEPLRRPDPDRGRLGS